MLNVRKETGWTSHDVVARLRRLSGQRRIGHAGTLDPLAEGVLPVLLGQATRLADFLQGGRKRYEAEVQLGAATSTDDAEGEVIAQAPVPEFDAQVLERFRGDILQSPPAYAAVKLDGQRAYALARRGVAVSLPPRPVTIYVLDLLWQRDDVVALDVVCSRGTYIRSLARDLAQALGTVGHLRRLVRTQVGHLTLDSAVTLAEVAEQGVPAHLLPPECALGDTPRLVLDQSAAAALAHGRPVPASLSADPAAAFGPDGQLMAVGHADGRLFRPRVVLMGA